MRIDLAVGIGRNIRRQRARTQSYQHNVRLGFRWPPSFGELSLGYQPQPCLCTIHLLRSVNHLFRSRSYCIVVIGNRHTCCFQAGCDSSVGDLNSSLMQSRMRFRHKLYATRTCPLFAPPTVRAGSSCSSHPKSSAAHTQNLHTVQANCMSERRPQPTCGSRVALPVASYQRC